MAAMLGNERAYGRAYNVMGEDTVTQVGFVELIGQVMERPVTLRHFDPAVLKSMDKPGPVFGQNVVYECHAVHTTSRLRLELGIRPRYTLVSGLAQTWQWYRAQGLHERAVDFGFEDRLLAAIGA
jgi:nucleoside-diphosphate-sugar epimerase